MQTGYVTSLRLWGAKTQQLLTTTQMPQTQEIVKRSCLGAWIQRNTTTTLKQTQTTEDVSHSSTGVPSPPPSTTTHLRTQTMAAVRCLCLDVWILTRPTTILTQTSQKTKSVCTTQDVSLGLANHTGPTTTATHG